MLLPRRENFAYNNFGFSITDAPGEVKVSTHAIVL